MALIGLLFPPGFESTREVTGWARGYLQASFRGELFHIHRATKKTGRRIVKHVYPRSEEVAHEDNGKKDDVFTLACYVIADNYYDLRNQFETALDTPGPGLLVHPYRGVFNVVVPDWTEVEATPEGGMARFNVTFEVDKTISLTAAPVTVDIPAAKKSLLDNILAAFATAYDETSRAAYALDDARAAIGSGFGVIDAAKKLASTQAIFQRALDNAKGNIIALSLDAEYLAGTFKELIDFGTDPAGTINFGATDTNSKAMSVEQKQIANGALAFETGTSALIADQPDYPAKLIEALQLQLVAASQVGLMATIPFESVEDAETAQTELFKFLDQLMAFEGIDDTVYESLREAKRAVYNDLQTRVIELPQIVAYDSPDVTSSLELVYKLYGGLKNERDIIDRNGVIHPGFIQSGLLQVKAFDV